MAEETESPAIAGVTATGDIQAVSRAAQVLALFANDTPELSVSAAAARLGLNRTTVHRYFLSMVSAGLLSREEQSGLFIPGPLAVQLGTFTLGRRTVVHLAERHLRELSAATRMTSVLSLWGSVGPVVARVYENPTGPVLITVPVGTQLSLDTSQAVLYLTYLADQLGMQRLRGVLPSASQQSIARRIDQARRDGMSASSFEDGITSIAAPVFGPTQICATLALVHTSSMLSERLDSAEAMRLRVAARQLTVEMGGVIEAQGELPRAADAAGPA